MIRLVRRQDYVRRPWKNGGGVTADIIASPEGVGLDTFDWRLSTAHVGSDGPFSTFAGIDRTLQVLAGGGMRLEIAGQAPVTLTPASPPHVFPGDTPTEAFLSAGAIDDLNLMTRRGRFKHLMRDETLAQPLALAPRNGGIVLVFVRDGHVRVQDGSASMIAEASDTLALTQAVTLEADAPARLTVMDIWPD